MTRPLYVSYYEARAIRKGLRLYQRHLQTKQRQSQRRGWTPELGHIDINASLMVNVDSAMEQVEALLGALEPRSSDD
jgi:hypothetical protein